MESASVTHALRPDAPEPRILNPESRVPNLEPRIPSPESRISIQIRWKFFSTSRREIRNMTGRPCGQTVE
jgi:hypothetical protein